MSISPVVALTAVNCPTITGPTSELLISGGVPTTFGTVSGGDTSNLITQFNQDAVRGDLIGRTGGGCYAIGSGLQLSATGTGLTLTVSLGHAMIDGPVQLAVNTTIACINGYNWIYLTQGSTLTSTTSATTTPPAPPSAYCCFLGRVHATGGNIDAIDVSGVLTFAGGMAYRRTADAGAPTDTPPSTLSFLALTTGGNYLWIGSLAAYFNIVDSLKVLSDDTHGSSGSLADLIIGDGATVSVSVVDVSGVWKLQLSATTSGGNTVAAYTGDLNPGFLAQKLKNGVDITWTETDDTLGTPTSKQVQPVLAGHTETLNSVTVSVPRGCAQTYVLDFHHRGTYAGAEYTVSLGVVTGSSNASIVTVEEVLSDGSITNTGYATISSIAPLRNNGRFLIRVTNNGTDEVTVPVDSVTITATLYGFGWVVGDTPGATVVALQTGPHSIWNSDTYEYRVRKTYTSIEADVAPGYYQIGDILLSNDGFFDEIDDVQIDCQNLGTGLEGVLISQLCNGQGRPYMVGGPYICSIRVEVLNPSGNVYGYSGHDPILLTVSVRGRNWTPAVSSPTSVTFSAVGSPIPIDGGGGGGVAFLVGGNTGLTGTALLSTNNPLVIESPAVTLESSSGNVNIESAVALGVTAAAAVTITSTGSGISLESDGGTVIGAGTGISFQAASTNASQIDQVGIEFMTGVRYDVGGGGSGTYTLTVPFKTYQRYNATSGTVTANLPQINSAIAGTVLTLFRVDSGINTVTVNAFSGQTVMGASSITIAITSSITLFADLTANNWVRIASG